MNILTAVRSYFGQYQARSGHYRTERLLRSLPPEVQKDIGWPGTADGLEVADRRLRANGRWH